MGGRLLREHRIGGASLRCGRPRAVRAAQAEIRQGEILGSSEERSQISTGTVCAQERSAAKTDPAQVVRSSIYSAERFARVQCPAKSRHHYSFYFVEPLRLTVIQRQSVGLRVFCVAGFVAGLRSGSTEARSAFVHGSAVRTPKVRTTKTADRSENQTWSSVPSFSSARPHARASFYASTPAACRERPKHFLA